MRKAEFVGGGEFIDSYVADHVSDVCFHVTILNRNESLWLRGGKEIVIVDVQDSEKLDKTIAAMDIVLWCLCPLIDKCKWNLRLLKRRLSF